MGICQWIMVSLWFLRFSVALGVNGQSRLAKDGSPQKYSAAATLFEIAMMFILLYFGGFFGRG